MKEIEASLRMGIYKDWQIHTKTSFRLIKLQESRSGPHTNRDELPPLPEPHESSEDESSESQMRKVMRTEVEELGY